MQRHLIWSASICRCSEMLWTDDVFKLTTCNSFWVQRSVGKNKKTCVWYSSCLSLYLTMSRNLVQALYNKWQVTLGRSLVGRTQRAHSINFDVESTLIFRRRFFNAFSTFFRRRIQKMLKYRRRIDVERWKFRRFLDDRRNILTLFNAFSTSKLPAGKHA